MTRDGLDLIHYVMFDEISIVTSGSKEIEKGRKNGRILLLISWEGKNFFLFFFGNIKVMKRIKSYSYN